MPIPERFWKSLHNEFSAFYDVSELPDSWEAWMSELDQETAASAARMRAWLANDADVADLAAFLRAESKERSGELVRQIQGWTRFAWGNQEEDWLALRQILRGIADQLDAQLK